MQTFIGKIRGQKIKRVGRRAKVLFFEFESGIFLLFHLKMTGQLIYQPKSHSRLILGGHPQSGGANNLPNKFTRAELGFADGSILFFNDLRKFGWMKIFTSRQAEDFFNRNGVEPLSAKFDQRVLTNLLERYPKRPVKQMLMDQSLIVGIGNIYADESCFCAGILPTRKLGNIELAEIKRLCRCIKRILKLSIKKKGTSFSDYLDSSGEPGGFVPYLNVYGRQGEKCRRSNCRGLVKKIKLNGRGTHFCDQCQK